ncbi:MAG TPA: ABC transporter permease [Chloroflexota bacterium]|nr:ABC transporter permease [Chloroflexota bacterium]
MGRFGFVIPRLIQLVPVAIGITIITFFLIHLIPGDPVVALLGNHYSDASAHALRAALGLDKPLWNQYLIFLGNLLHGDLGNSIYYEEPVRDLIFSRIEPTVWLVVYAAALSAIISVPLGMLAALKRDSVIDQAIRGFFLVALAMPAFWVGIILVLIFSIHFSIFPVSGFGDTIPSHIEDLFLPALTIALSFGAVLIRSLRNSTLSVLRADYVDTARAKGLPNRVILGRHVLRNALLSTVTIFGVNIAFLMGATVIVENVFALGGIGQLLVSAIQQRDYAVVQGITLLIAFFVIVINLLTDVAYGLLDPRVQQ